MANVGTSGEKTGKNIQSSINIEEVVTSLRTTLDDLPFPSHLRCIYEVPYRLRKINEEAYTPFIVSIGPLHHGKEGLKPMEEHKRRYLQHFLQRSQKGLEEFVKFMDEREERTRQCYATTISFSRNKFVEIILVDSAFIIEVLLRYWSSSLRGSVNDPIFEKPWMIIDIVRDLRLLENQLPFFVLEDLFKMANIKVDSDQDNTPTLIELVKKYFECLMNLGGILETKIESSNIKHLVDLQRSWIIPRARLEQPESDQTKMKRAIEFKNGATELHEAGVRFKVSSSKKLFDIKFIRGTGVLEIPYIEICDATEGLLRNVLAYEQCHFGFGYISDYVVLVHSLIKTSKDVDLLVQSGVIGNCLGHSEDVLNVVNKLAKGVTVRVRTLYFKGLIKELHDYCKSSMHKWKANLRHDYCNTPWRVLAIGVAFTILVLTFGQTVCSIISLFHK